MDKSQFVTSNAVYYDKQEGDELYDEIISSKVSELINYQKKIPRAKRFSYRPDEDIEAHEFFKLQENQMWNAQELNYSKDKEDYDKLDVKHKKLVNTVLAFFACTDGLVCNNIAARFLMECKTMPEIAFYSFQLAIESVHAETYSLMIDTLVTNKAQKAQLFSAADNMKVVKIKNDWAEKYIESNLTQAHRLIAFAAVEGIFFTSSFIFIFFFRSKGILQQLITGNEFIARDEGLHRDFACMRYRRMKKLPDEEVNQIIRDAVEIECRFVDEVIPEPIDELDSDLIKKFVKNLGNKLLEKLGHKPIWDISHSEFPHWMELGGEIKQNFYEGLTTNYSKSSRKQSNVKITNPNDIAF